MNEEKEESGEEKEGSGEEKEGSVERPEESLMDHKEKPSSLTTQHTTDEHDDSKGMTKCKPRKLPSWLLTAAAGGGAKKEAKKTKRAKSPEVVPDSKVCM